MSKKNFWHSEEQNYKKTCTCTFSGLKKIRYLGAGKFNWKNKEYEIFDLAEKNNFF
jgi:hypothetical protein